MLRKWITPLATGSFALVGITGILLFLNVRIELVARAHEWLSPVFVVASVLHVWLNRGALKAHLRRPIGRGIVAGFALLTLAVLVLPIGHGESGGPGEAMKLARAVKPSLVHARVGLLAELARIEPAEARRRLEVAGLQGVCDSSRLDEVAQSNGIQPGKALLALFEGEGEAKD